MSTIEKDYTIKILILFLATGAGVFAIWYTMIREQSADWISAQVVHQVSPYAVTETEDGLIISNVLIGYGFDLPKGFKTTGAKNLVLFREEAGVKKCEIKHHFSRAEKAADSQAKIVLSAESGGLVFELVNQNEINDCGKYLREIKDNAVVN